MWPDALWHDHHHELHLLLQLTDVLPLIMTNFL